MVINSDDCWLWAGYIDKNSGYGTMFLQIDGKSRSRRAHRLVYESLMGEIPEGLVLDHLCRVRHCVNPDHLEPVSQQVNILRGIGTGALNARKTECLRGHPYTEENLYKISTLNERRCRTCHKERQLKYKRSLLARPTTL